MNVRGSQHTAGFTLAELLVVIAIVSLLAALLLPVLNRVRESGRASSCLAHERQIAAATLAYLQDWDERFPQTHPAADMNGPTGAFSSPPPPEAQVQVMNSWRGALAAYVRAPALFGCPSDTGFPEAHPSSYAPNGYLCYGAQLPEVARPAEIILAAEIADGTLVEDLYPWLGQDTLAGDIALDRHRGRAQYAFIDGHVTVLAFEQTLSPRNCYRPSP